MLEGLADSENLREVHESLESRFPDEILEWRFEKGELTAKVGRDILLAVLEFLKGALGFNALNDIIALDRGPAPGEEAKRFSLLYQLYKFPEAVRIRIVVEIAEDEPAESVCAVYKSANWAEREIYDMFGIRFDGHPDLRRIYMPDDFEGYPLRKDFPLEGKTGAL
jgi:NADH-quinone oxidoreductase subunit C